MGKKKIAIVGHFGGKENCLDGQTVKTKVLYQELLNFTDWKIQIVDTYYRKKNPVKLMWDLFCSLLTTKDFIILLSGNGMRVFFPMFAFFSKLFGKRFYHDVIGGNLDGYVAKFPKYKDYLNSFRVNWVETGGMKNRLEKQGITTCSVLPNFKRLNCVSKENLKNELSCPLRLCTFSRVMKEKGIEDAVNAVKKANETLGDVVFTLDIFGQIDPNQTQWFEGLKQSFPESICYGGLVPFDKSVEVLKDYFALLFPTRYYTEGVRGTIIDAYAAGIPVISSKWENFSDVIDEGITGIGYEFENTDDFEKVLMEIAQHPKMVLDLKENCLRKAKDFMPQSVIQIIKKRIEG